MSYVADLDKDENLVIIFTVNGTRYAYTKVTLIEALGLKGKTLQRNQASLSKSISWLLSDIENGKLMSQRQARERLTAILDSFDGEVSKNRSRIGFLLGQIASKRVGVTCKGPVLEFFRQHPEIVPTKEEQDLYYNSRENTDDLGSSNIDDDPGFLEAHYDYVDDDRK